MPHPDDEFQVWSLVEDSSANYKLFIFLTHGEQTSACRTAASSAGPFWFEGPNSPAGEPDNGEVRPHSNPWQGEWEEPCYVARRAATINYLEDVAVADPSIPADFSLRGSYTFSGTTDAGLAPGHRDADGTLKANGSARVYDAGNGMGKVIFFHLGDGDLEKEEVKWALEKVASNKSLLGIPSLPDLNGVGAYWNVSYNCDVYAHPDHQAVHEALWEYSLVDGPQHGRTCRHDPNVDPLRTASVSSASFAANKEKSGDTAVGPFQRRYGWLFDGNVDHGWGSGGIRAQTQHFWTR